LLNLSLGGAYYFTNLLNIHITYCVHKNIVLSVPKITKTGSGVLKMWAVQLT